MFGKISKPTPEELEELRNIASFQFRGVGKEFITKDVYVVRSPKTYRIRAIILDNRILATVRASDYRLLLRIYGGLRLNKILDKPFMRVMVSNKYAKFIIDGGNVFAPHILFMDPEIRPHEEVLVVDEDWNLIAVGKAILPGWIATLFNRGEVVRVRESIGRVKEECLA